MNELTVFINPEFGEIRTLTDDEKRVFVGADVARALGYQNTSKAINDHCKGVTKRYIPTNGGEQLMNVITIGDVFRLAANSELPGAVRFESWIFDEVLPAIDKHGAYMTPETIEKAIMNPDFVITLAQRLKDEQGRRAMLEGVIERDKPKVLFANAVEASHTSILVGDLAKLIKQNGVDIGQNRLFAWLRNNGYLIKGGDSKNMPTQRYMEQGLFQVKETSTVNPDGSIRVTKTTKVTGKGQTYFINLFLREHGGLIGAAQ